MSETLAAVEMVYGTFGLDASIAIRRIEQCEQRLATKLPEALRTIYVRTGDHPFHRACDRLVAPEQLAYRERFLVFYEQDQGALCWGIGRDTLTADDPPVWALYDDEAVPDSTTVSDFFAFEAAWQAINGGALPCYGILDDYVQEPSSRLGLNFDAWGRLLATTRHGQVRYRSGAISLHRAEGGGFLGLAASSAAVFHEAATDLGVAHDRWTLSSFVP